MDYENITDTKPYRFVPLPIPSGYILQAFSDEYQVPIISALQLSYTIVLQLFFEARSYIYAGNEKLESDHDIQFAGDGPYLIDFQSVLAHRSTVLESLRHQTTSLGNDNSGNPKALMSFACDLDRKGENQPDSFVAYFGYHPNAGSIHFDPQHLDTSKFARYDFCLLMPSYQSHITEASLLYKPAKCTEFQAQNFALAFRQVLERIVEQPHILVSEVDLVGKQHRSMIHGWNLEPPQAKSACIHHLIHLTAQKHPNKLAITHWDGDLTYAQLDLHADRLANHLVFAHGLEPGHKVPICFNKSIWAIVTMLAILKTGASYCCLDPDHPQARRKFIIKALEAPIIIISPLKKSLFLEYVADRLLIVDSALVENLPVTDGPVASTVTPKDICVIAFTSGSTGTPKGIVHTHTSMSTGLLGNAPRLDFDKVGLRVFQWSAYTFDISYYEIFGTLIHGGCICGPSDEERLYDVAGAMNRMKCEWAWFTPSFSRFFRRYNVPTLKTLTLGGEKLRVDDVKAWSSRVKLIHLYGPAETITAFTKPVDLTDIDDTPATAHLSFGGMVNAHGWIVDPNNHDRLLPVGAIGELLIEGPGLFQGYLNDKVRTKAVLLGSPAWRDSIGLPRNNSIYATGDMVRYMPGAGMACLGRKDGMAKLRGQRLDLGEIESVLREMGLGAEAEVAVDIITPAERDQAQDSMQVLVAFLRFSHMQNLGEAHEYVASMAQTWQGQLRSKLPEFMVPRFYHALESIPYNASGKLDRKALKQTVSGLSVRDIHGVEENNGNHPVEKQMEPNPELERLMPPTPAQSLFQRLWAEILNKKSIKLTDNFFALGGSSLDVIRLVAWARDQGFLIQHTDVFGSPVLRDMADKAIKLSHDARTNINKVVKPFELLPGNTRDKILSEAASQCLVSEADIEDAFPLTLQQHGLWAASLSSGGPGSPGSYVSHFQIHICEHIDAAKLRSVWDKVVNAAGFMRSRFVQCGNETYQVVLKKSLCSEWKLAYGVDVDTYIRYDLEKPLDFGTAVTRYVFLEEQRRVIWTSHHALYDGNSLHLFLNAVAKAYRGERWDSSRSITFNHVIQHLQQATARESEESKTKAFWQSRYEIVDGSCVINFPRIPYPSYRPNPSRLCTSRIVFEQPQRSTVTNANVLRAALALTIARLTGASNVNFLETLDGRSVSVPGIESIIGPTFATVPKNTLIKVDQSAESFLEEIQRISSEMIPHSQYGLQKISQLSPACAAACEFQTLLVIEPRMSTVEYRDIFEFDEEGGGMHRFNSGCVLWKCDLDEKSLDLTASFDEHVIPEYQLRLMMYTFEGTVKFLCNSDRSNRPVSEILGFHPAVCSSAIMRPYPQQGLNLATFSPVKQDHSDIPNKAITSMSEGSRSDSGSTPSPTSDSSLELTSILISLPSASPEETSTDIPLDKGMKTVEELSSVSNLTSTSVPEITEPTTSPVAIALKKAWLESLGIDESRFSPKGNFFHQGGNSVRAMGFVAMARRACVSITVAKVFQNPCFEALVSVATSTKSPPLGLRPGAGADTGFVLPFSFLGSPERKESIIRTAVSQCGFGISEVEDIYPATQLQAEFMASLQTKVGAFMAQVRYEIPQSVSVEQFQSIWEKLQDTYPILRTRLISHSGCGVFQAVLKNTPIRWTLSDDMSEYLVHDRNTPTGYGAPLARYAIVKQDNQLPTMVWTIIHSLYDSFTLDIMHHAMAERLAGRNIKPAPSSAPFVKYLTGIDKEAEKLYWTRYLSGYVAHKPFPTLPNDTYSPRADTIKSITIRLPVENSRTTITMSTIYMAAWALVAGQANGQDDIIFGYCPSGRSVPVDSIGDIMMPTVAHVPIRIKVSCEQAISRFLRDLQMDQSEMIAWEQAGLSTISTYNESCYAALSTFQSMLIVQNQSSATITGGGGEAGGLYREEVTDNVLFNDRALMAYIAPSPASGTAEVYFSYDSHVVREDQIVGYAQRFEHVLGVLVVEDDEVTLSEVY